MRAWFQRCHVRYQTNLGRKRGQAATELRTHYARNTKDPGVLSAVERASLDMHDARNTKDPGVLSAVQRASLGSLNVLLTDHEITGN